ncbi:DNA-binding response regulator [Actinomyces sp. 2119]|uniref:response regulator n=1 Tax=Actinomyces sp. 2119 TaxID=2321393 RepID=UPI000E6BB2A2|nr:DNA-binding response regulator [Actinomyces sp. 2119]
MILDAQKDMVVVGEAADGQQALVAAQALHPDVILMDVRMPLMDGIEATRVLARRDAQVRVLVLTTFDLDDYVVEALCHGASGFLLKDVSAPELIAGVRAVARGDSVVAPSATRRLLSRWVAGQAASGASVCARPRGLPGPSAGAQAPPTGTPTRQDGRLAALSAREREVLALVGRALSNREIAERLVVAESTVKTHINRILRKLAVRDRVGLVVLAYETGLVRPGDED